MFNLIRRISYSVIPRSDRPWADDPTSNAPQTRKRRRSSGEFDQPGPSSSPLPNGHSVEDPATGARGEDGEASTKKLRREDSMDVSESGPSSPSLTATSVNPNINKRKSLGERYPIWGFSLGLGRPQARSAVASSGTTQQSGEQQETEDVKAVTKGVKDVEIIDKDEVAPESVPLPIADDDELVEGKDMDGDGDEDEEVKGAAELDKEESKAQVDGDEKVEEQKQVVAEPDEGQTTNEDDDVASSANGEDDEIQEIPPPVAVHVEETHLAAAATGVVNVTQTQVSA